MKRIIFSLLVLSGVAGAAQAQTVTVADVEALPGETVTATLHLEAPADTYTGTQFAMQFPATGFTLAAIGAASGWSGSLEYGTMTAGKVKFAAAASKTFETAAIDVEFSVDDDLALGDYDVTVTDIVFEGAGGKNTLADVTFTVKVVDVHSVLLDETSTTAPEAATNVNVVVKRTINAGEWSTICLPFAMTEAQVKAAFGDDVQLGDFDGYEAITDNDDNVVGLRVMFLDATAIEANHPYIIKVSLPITEFAVDGVDINPEDEPTVAAVKRTKKQWSEMIGTYVANTTLEATNLFLSGNQFWYSAGSTKMKAYRAYFDFYDVLSEVEEAYTSRISFVFDGSTSISSNNRETIDDNRYYDLQGRRVPPSVIRNSELKQGLYIVNGKKVVVK